MHTTFGGILALALSATTVTTDIKRQPYAVPRSIIETPIVYEEPSDRLEKLAMRMTRRIFREGKEIQLEIPGLSSFPGRAFIYRAQKNSILAAGPVPCVATTYIINDTLVDIEATEECVLFRQDTPTEETTYLLMTVDGTRYFTLGGRSFRMLEDGLSEIERQLCIEE